MNFVLIRVRRGRKLWEKEEVEEEEEEVRMIYERRLPPPPNARNHKTVFLCHPSPPIQVAAVWKVVAETKEGQDPCTCTEFSLLLKV